MTEGRRYEVRLVGFNSAGRGTDSNVVQFSLGEVLEIDGPAERTVTENYAEVLGVYTVDGTATWSLSGADAAAFDLVAASGGASLSFSSPPDFEAPADIDQGGPNTYHVTVVATLTEGASLSDHSLADMMAAFQRLSDDSPSAKAAALTQAVVVAVVNVDEADVVSLPEGPPRVGETLTARLEDDDVATLAFCRGRRSGRGRGRRPSREATMRGRRSLATSRWARRWDGGFRCGWTIRIGRVRTSAPRVLPPRRWCTPTRCPAWTVRSPDRCRVQTRRRLIWR